MKKTIFTEFVKHKKYIIIETFKTYIPSRHSCLLLLLLLFVQNILFTKISTRFMWPRLSNRLDNIFLKESDITTNYQLVSKIN